MIQTLSRLFLLLVATALAASAQPYYPGLVRGPKQELGPGVTWQAITHADPAWSIHVIEVDMTRRAVEIVPVFKAAGNVSGSANETTSALAERSGALAAINAGYFTIDGTRLTNSYTLIDGRFIGGSGTTLRPEDARTVIGFSGDRQALAKRTKLSSGFVAAEPEGWNRIVDAIAGRGHFRTAGGVLLVSDPEGTAASHYAERHPRTTMGFSLNPYRVWLVTVDGRQAGLSVGMTYEEKGKLMADLGVEESVCLDGGGSTAAWIRGRGIVNSPSDGSERTVVSAWAVVRRATIDNASSEFTDSGTWTTQAIPSANLHFGVDHRIAAAGATSASATWRPALDDTANYRVLVRWVAASLRSPTATYRVDHASGSTTVTVDQRSGGSTWHELGTFAFRAGTGGSVTLSGSAAGSVSADVVRFVHAGGADRLAWRARDWRTVASDGFGPSGDLAARPIVRQPADGAAGDSLWRRDTDLASFATPVLATPPGGDGRVLQAAANQLDPAENQLVYQLHGAESRADQAIEAWVLGYLGSDNASGPTTWGGFGVRMSPTWTDGYIAQHRVDSPSSLGSHVSLVRLQGGEETLLGRYYFKAGTGGITQGVIGDSRVIADPEQPATNRWVRLRLEAVGDVVSLHVDGHPDPVAVFRDPSPIATGSVGLFHQDPIGTSLTSPAGSSATLFENLRVEVARPVLPAGWIARPTALEPLPGGGLKLVMPAPAGFRFDVEATSDLRAWSALPGEHATGGDGILAIDDPGANGSTRFWRLLPR